MARTFALPLIGALGGALGLGLVACDLPQAHGDVNALIVASDPEIWQAVEDDLIDTLEPTIQTITDERAYRVTWHDPEERRIWGDLRRFRQVLVIGTVDDHWVAPALEKRGRGAAEISPPELIHLDNVWSRGQIVHVLVLGPEHGAAEVMAHADELHDRIDQRFRTYATNRMFTSGRNTELADSLGTNVGFSILLPNVYRYSVQDSVYRFRNDNPTPTERIREIGVSWKTPIPDELPGQEALIEWRNDFADAYYNDAQVVETRITDLRPVSIDGSEALEFQASWSSPPGEWPAGGPFITRVITCPDQDRMYFADAWLYAPGQDKYEYMIQLQTILNSFHCGSGAEEMHAEVEGEG
ncbi:MAG: DUF4837 family protein [Gemmatimonadales bacterium]|nr:MAG: DUF4837 family protein [Gemmatimonadales bacterium]